MPFFPPPDIESRPADSPPALHDHFNFVAIAQAECPRGSPEARQEAPRAAAPQKPPKFPFKGSLYLIGGAADVTFTDLVNSGGKDVKVACVALASSAPNAAVDLAESFVQTGVKPENVTIIIKEGDRAPTKKFKCSETVPADAGIVYFSGGAQDVLRSRFSDKQLAAVRTLLENGAIISGSSAGAAAMPLEMITGGNEKNLQHAAGFGLTPWGVMDTHVRQRQREPRDVVALHEIGHGSLPVFGLDKDTSVRFSCQNGRLTGEVGGANTLEVFTSTTANLNVVNRQVVPTIVKANDGSGREARLWELRKGDTFELPYPPAKP
jgi:cyanophycinase